MIMTEPTDEEMKEYIRAHKCWALGHFLWLLPSLIFVFLGSFVKTLREEWVRQRGGRS